MNYDNDQRIAIEELDNCLVIAGAGSGKTTTIVGKINFLTQNGYCLEDEILVISFTNETVNSLKDKVNLNVDIKTFHKLALDIVRLNFPDTKVAGDSELRFVIDEYLNSYARERNISHHYFKRLLYDYDEKYISKFIESFINIYKCNFSDLNKLFDLYNKSRFKNRYYLKLILDVYIIYLRELESSGKMDFNDLIISANEKVSNNFVNLNYKYIIIDEFQDISLIRLNLIRAIIKQTGAKLFCVGDDYQSIYRFSGCDLSLFINFRDFFPDAKVHYLNYNYRSFQSLVDVANNFIMKNKLQMKKKTICLRDSSFPLKIIYYSDIRKVVRKTLDMVSGDVLILGRNNVDKKRFFVSDQNRFLTVHSAKGIEEDNIILINLYNNVMGFPSRINNDELINKILNRDYIIHEEERRLFYVALTRSRNFVYLLVPYHNQSIFVGELINDNNKKIETFYFD